MTTTHLMRQRPHAKGKHQRAEQRQDWRGYPDDGQVWGQGGWAVGPIAAPTLTSISPTSGSAAAGPFTVLCNGTGFILDSKIQVDGVAVNTFYILPTQLSTQYDPSATGTTQFTVRNPDGKVTTAKPFTVGALAADPAAVLEGTIDEVKAYVNGLPADEEGGAIVQQLIDYERAHKNRTSLVTWLDQQLGVV